MKKNKKKLQNSQTNGKISKLLNSRKKFVVLGVIVFLFLLGVGYGVVQVYAQIQREKYEQEQKSVQATQQLDAILEEMKQLRQDNEQLRTTPTPTPSSVVKKVAAPEAANTTTGSKQAGCTQSKLDAFKKAAFASGYDETQVNALIDVAKASGCPKISATDRTLNDIDSKLDRIQMCQSYGICY